MHAADNSILGVALAVLALLGLLLFYKSPKEKQMSENVTEPASNLRLANESEVASVAIARNADGSIASCEIVGDAETIQIYDDLIAQGILKQIPFELELVDHDENGFSFFKRVKEGKDG